ncbi:FHA domain-containing protein [Pseudomonas sp. NMI542_15]|uniref:FHA domain-containing protein n=1 Tax=Pseudomonas sp. NMI542_15 TaxID=2903148 RepID=UPI001E33CBD8|nr:FHA domain-containing protein [Pseudomonas sp. NMI542_15]MCE0777930.1 FHA domain-containing protein [Pseudomonas sp. NMI542_15]
MSTLILSIINLDQLQHNVTARHRFDRTGGTLGSAGATWRINDREQTVAPIHCEIRWTEGSFCVIDRCQRTYLNDSHDSVGSLAPRRLLDGDQLRIGAYRLQVQLSQADARSLGDLFSHEQRTLDHWLLEAPATAWRPLSGAKHVAADICSAFAPGIGNDPLAALDKVTGAAQENPLEHLIAGERP